MKDSNQIELDWQRLPCFVPVAPTTTKLWDPAGKLMLGQKCEMQVSICEAGEKERYFRLLAKSRLRAALTSCIKCVLSAVVLAPSAHLDQSLQRDGFAIVSPL